MVDNARNYTPTTRRRLDLLSGNVCAEPNCRNILTTQNGEIVIAQIAHIEAANAGGNRYNPNMSDDERRHFNNLLLLCDEHHKTVDHKPNEALYPASLLREWKKNHEAKQQQTLSNNPTLLSVAIKAIAKLKTETIQDNLSVESFDIRDKITYNMIVRNVFLIEDYKIYNNKISALYQELEEQGSFRKEQLLSNIRNIYLKIAGKHAIAGVDRLKVIRNNADNIIEDVEQELMQQMTQDESTNSNDFSFAISVIMVDAFMRCKILEEPLK
jgi:hypothetical protein